MREPSRLASALLGADKTEPISETTKQLEERTFMTPAQREAGSERFLASVIVPRATSTRDITALETAMQGLALDSRHPVALELAATASSRHFLLRATSAMSLRHLVDQVQARYPQAIIRPVSQQDDPFALREGEMVSAIELCAGAAAYLPLHAWRERELLQEGADPLLGILAAFNHLPAHMRVVTQLALVPAPPTWSRTFRRKSVEHPLEKERLRERRELSRAQASDPGTFQLVGMSVLVALLLVWLRFKRQLDGLIPSWLWQAGLSLLHGKTPRLSSAHLAVLEIRGIVALAALFCLAFLIILQIRSHRGTNPIYDMHQVDEKTARPAYRVRLRLFVFSRGTAPLPASHTRLKGILLQLLSRQPFTWSSLKDAYYNWRETAQRNQQHRQEQGEVLDHLVAAYRQYHTASGGYFAPRRISQRMARRFLVRQSGWLRSRISGWDHALARSPHLLSVADIAALWHLPQAQDLADLPYVERARARTALAPVELTQGNGWKIGTSSHAGHCSPVFLPEECLRHNLLAIASTWRRHCVPCAPTWTTQEGPAWPFLILMAMSYMHCAGCFLHMNGTMWCWSIWPIPTIRWVSIRLIW